jgi:hypothetical protein
MIAREGSGVPLLGLDGWTLAHGRLRVLPVAPGRMEFAWAVRQVIRERLPEAVAVALPATISEAVERAVARLPALSVVIYREKGRDVYFPVEITDPMIEAVRTARELHLPWALVEPDLGAPAGRHRSHPDSYAARRLGLDRYVRACIERRIALGFDERRLAAGIAFHLSRMLDRTGGEVVAVVDLRLAVAVLDALEGPQALPLSRSRRERVSVFHLHPECLAEVLVEMPFLQAVYERRRAELPPEPASAAHRTIREIGPFRVIGGAGEGEARSASAAADRVARRLGPVSELADRQRLLIRLFAEAETRYRQSTGERLQPWQRRTFGRFSRNLALASGQLLADLFDLAVAARGVADDNLGWEVWELGASFPEQPESAELATVRISGDAVWDGVKRVRLVRRTHKPKSFSKPRGLRGRKAETRPGEWLESFDGQGLCSYPPEDLVVEGYGQLLKRKGKSILSEERARTEPFTTSLLDGIDIRETIRNWHLSPGKPLFYVRELGKVVGEAGSVVLVFDEDRENRYPFCMTWIGEHDQESDMAFYATDPRRAIVGPGITRAEYGGLVLSHPPRRMRDVWTDQDYAHAESKAEVLLLAGLDYSVGKLVVYAAPRPPRSFMKTVAERWGLRILYLPLGQLSPVTLRKVRVVHLLDGHDKRPIAKDYIW